MPLTEAVIREIAGSLVPPACEIAIVAALADLDVYEVWTDEVAKQKITLRLQADSEMHQMEK